MKRDEVFVGRLKVRIQTSVRLPTTFGRLATFEIGFEIYQSENDDGQAMFFSSLALRASGAVRARNFVGTVGIDRSGVPPAL